LCTRNRNRQRGADLVDPDQFALPRAKDKKRFNGSEEELTRISCLFAEAMMLNTILVPLSGVDADNLALECAYRFSKQFGSHIDCLYARADPRVLLAQTATLDIGGALITPELWSAIEKEDKARGERVRTVFEGFCARWTVPVSDSPGGLSGISATLQEVIGDAADEILRHGRVREMTVLAHPSEGGMSLEQVGEILIRSGRPLVLAPRRVSETIGTTIAIAWKGTAEAAHALTAAMPLLGKAKKVMVLSADEGGGSSDLTIASAERLVDALRWDGIDAELHRLSAASRDASEQILDAASHRGADLVVMGGYSHSRARELVFGGFTRHVLSAAKLPILLCH
jgi:nucleotide-binding universal stress UspA family protein